MCTWHVWDALGTLAVGPSLVCSDCADRLPDTRTRAGPTHPATSQPSSGSLGLCFQHLVSPLPVPSSSKSLGCADPESLMGEAGEARPGNRVRPSFPLWQHRANPCFVVYGADVTSSGQSHFFFKLDGTSFWAPRCCPREPNNHGMVGRGTRPAKVQETSSEGCPGP